MRVWLRLTLPLLLAAAVGCGGPRYRQLRAIHADTPDCPVVWSASIVTLLQHPQEFYGHCVVVSGYFQIDALYLTADHARIYARDLAVPVGDTPRGALVRSRCNGAYVSLVGRVAEVDGAALLHDVQRLTRYSGEPLKPQHECWSKHAG